MLSVRAKRSPLLDQDTESVMASRAVCIYGKCAPLWMRITCVHDNEAGHSKFFSQRCFDESSHLCAYAEARISEILDKRVFPTVDDRSSELVMICCSAAASQMYTNAGTPI